MKKVLHIAQFLKYGSSTGIIALITQLKKRGISSELLLSYPCKGHDHSKDLLNSLSKEGVRVSFVDSTFQRSHWNVQAIQNKILKDYPKSSYNYITHGGFPAYALSLLNVCFYHVCHGFGMNRPKFIDKQDYIGISKAKHVYAVSKDIIDQLLFLGITRDLIQLMYYPLDIKRIEYPRPREIKTLAVVGALIKRKGHVYAVEVFNQLLKERVDLQLLFFGDGEEEKDLRSIVAAQGLEDRVSFKGFCSVAEIFSQIDILLVPSLSEGLGMVNLEAFLYGIPVVAFDSGGIKEIIENGYTGLLAKRKNCEDLASKVSQYLDDYNRAFCHANNGFHLSKKLFSTERNLRHLYQVLK